ncbi:hypothetical protein ELH51_12865 [Rhizobium ruizarguesonis]|uniref:hypothetical protein n=1 Tax=Rhizobium ruizarguesonis TaxID=2081791 RepID=UPI0010301F38|nr:hypothetical protein [Rhizobium ruizarguesonis]TBB22535.1 hypothetical protein ELH51_12865 [Rhizobium ruizarguesonis]
MNITAIAQQINEAPAPFWKRRRSAEKKADAINTLTDIHGKFGVSASDILARQAGQLSQEPNRYIDVDRPMPDAYRANLKNSMGSLLDRSMKRLDDVYNTTVASFAKAGLDKVSLRTLTNALDELRSNAGREHLAFMEKFQSLALEVKTGNGTWENHGTQMVAMLEAADSAKLYDPTTFFAMREHIFETFTVSSIAEAVERSYVTGMQQQASAMERSAKLLESGSEYSISLGNSLSQQAQKIHDVIRERLARHGLLKAQAAGTEEPTGFGM